MKKVLVIGFLLIVSNCLFSQNYNGSFSILFFGRQSSAKIEAMGQASTAVTGELSSVYFNPAGISDLKGVQIYNNISRGFFLLDSAISNNFGIGSKVGEKWAVAYSLQTFNYNEKISFIDENDNIINTVYPKPYFIHKLSSSYKPIKTLSIGISVNLLDPLMLKAFEFVKFNRVLFFDFGIIKEFSLFKNDFQEHKFNLGASISNFTNSESKFEYNNNVSTDYLPVTNRYGINYDFTLSKNWLVDSLNTFKISVVADYSFLLNSKYYSGYNVGCQLEIFDFLSARIGYYSRSNDIEQNLQILKRKNALTYGFGLSIPIDKLTELPLKINFDYCNLPQDNSSIEPIFIFPNFNSFTGSIRWFFK